MCATPPIVKPQPADWPPEPSYPQPLPREDREANQEEFYQQELPDCHLDRYEITRITTLLKTLCPELDLGDIEKVVKEDINFKPGYRGPNAPEDKLPLEHRGRFKAETSISAFEAYTFIKNLKAAGILNDGAPYSKIGQGLLNLFFVGSIDSLPHSYKVENAAIHDADTRTIIDRQDASCNTGETITMSVRSGATDAPEVGSSKLVDNAEKVHQQLSTGQWDPKNISKKEHDAFDEIVKETIKYTGLLSTLIMDDLAVWESPDGAKEPLIFVGSLVNWISDDTPKELCGIWQPYDMYGRGLALFFEDGKKRLGRYMRTRLAKAMEEKGAAIYDEYRQVVGKYLVTLMGSKNGALKQAALNLVDGTPKPSDIYSQDECVKMADTFDKLVKESKFSDSADDIQLLQIATGSVYAYMKYRNQYGELYETASNMAREQKLGFWKETTFKALWDFNSKMPRYDPPTC